MTTAAIEGACRACMRRIWLLSKLSARLDYRVKREESRVLELLELEDRELIEAIGGRWRTELRERWERFELDDKSDEPDAIDKLDANGLGADAGVETVCRHCPGYPSALRARRGAPRVLHVVGGAERLGKLTAGPAVAIVGSERPTDYGMEMAHSLARGLAASGVTVVSGFANGIAAGAHAGALEVRGPTVTVMAGGVDVIRPAARRGLYERVTACGCAVAEPPCGYLPRRWCGAARARTIAGLVGLTIVVEADEGSRELIGVHAARSPGPGGGGGTGACDLAGEQGHERAADGGRTAGARAGRRARPAVRGRGAGAGRCPPPRVRCTCKGRGARTEAAGDARAGGRRPRHGRQADLRRRGSGRDDADARGARADGPAGPGRWRADTCRARVWRSGEP